MFIGGRVPGFFIGAVGIYKQRIEHSDFLTYDSWELLEHRLILRSFWWAQGSKATPSKIGFKHLTASSIKDGKLQRSYAAGPRAAGSPSKRLQRRWELRRKSLEASPKVGTCRRSRGSCGYGSKLNHGTAGCSQCVHVPGFHFGCLLFLTHSHMSRKPRFR